MPDAAEPKASLNSLNADLIANNVQGSIALRDGGNVTFYVASVDASKARDAVKAALKDALSAL